MYRPDGSFSYSCITFGSPPVIRPSIPSQVQSGPREGLVINFINEFDLVSRADGPYILSLINLHRSIYRMPRMQGVDTPSDNVLEDIKSFAPFDSSSVESSTGKIWISPRAFFTHVGERVVLHMQLCEESLGSGNDDEVELIAFRVQEQAFQNLLFCRIAVHSRIEYRRRVELIAQGCFNGLKGWGKSFNP